MIQLTPDDLYAIYCAARDTGCEMTRAPASQRVTALLSAMDLRYSEEQRACQAYAHAHAPDWLRALAAGEIHEP